MRLLTIQIKIEPGHSISYKKAYVPSEDRSACASSRATLQVVKDPKRLQADSEDSDQTARMRQADLSLRWSHMHYCRKCCAPAKIISSDQIFNATRQLSHIEAAPAKIKKKKLPYLS